MTDVTQGQDAPLPGDHEMFPDKLPDVDQMFPDRKTSDSTGIFARNNSPVHDMIFADPGRAHARVLDAFGYGFNQNWGAGTQEFSEADEALRKAGIYNDYAKGQHSIIKAANEAVMRMLFAIDKAGTDPVEHVKGMLAEKKKVSGFGHRVYHTEDPRATHLRKMSEDLGKSAGKAKWFEMSRQIEVYIKGEKKLNANVDFYSASTYTTLGIDIDLFTPIFAVSRIAGWAAHVIEQLDDNRLIRPRAEYIGPEYPAPYVAIESR